MPNRELLQSFVAGEFDCQSLRPTDLREVYQDGVITVRRSEDENPVLEGQTPHPAGDRYLGVNGFSQALAELHTALGLGGERHVKFKLYRIESATADPPRSGGQEASTFNTLVRYEASRHGPDGNRQQTAIWNCRWTYAHSDESVPGKAVPLLTHIAPARYEEADVRSGLTARCSPTAPSLPCQTTPAIASKCCPESTIGSRAFRASSWGSLVLTVWLWEM